MSTKIGTMFGAILLCVSAACGLVALGLTVVDVFARYALSRPYNFEEIVELLLVATVMFGAAAALYVFRDPAAPRGLRWLGWPGAAFVSLAAMAAIGFTIYGLGDQLVFTARTGDITTMWRLPTWLAPALALFGCTVIAIFALANSLWARSRFPVVPVALALLIAGLLIGLIGIPFASLGRLVAQAFLGYGYIGLAALAAGVVAGAVAALKGEARIAALAAPALSIAIAGLVGEASIARMVEAGLVLFALMALGHALLGLARGFRAATDDLIGLGVLVLSIPPIAIGILTPSETWAILAVPCLIVLATIAVILRRDNVTVALAQGWVHGIRALFLLSPVTVLAALGGHLGAQDWIVEALAPVLQSAAAIGVLLIATTTLLAALMGMPAGVALAIIVLMPSAVKAGANPTSFCLAAAFAGMAGGSLFGWLAPRLARATPEDCTAVPAREAVLAALPPLIAALLLWFVPVVALRLD